jgi:death-on-curing protein
MKEVVFLEVVHVMKCHIEALRVSGGADGIRDEGLLESAVMAPQQGYLTTLSELAANYIHGLAKNHPFIDGNKRTAFCAGLFFLRANGYRLKLRRNEWVSIIEGVADGSVSRTKLTQHLLEAMGSDERVR